MSEALYTRSGVDSFFLEWSKPLHSRLGFILQDVSCTHERMLSNMRRLTTSGSHPVSSHYFLMLQCHQHNFLQIPNLAISIEGDQIPMVKD